MLSRQVKVVCGILLFGLAVMTAFGSDFRLSFIEDKTVLEDTCRLLKESGVAEDSVATFRKLVTEHDKPGNRVDRGRFPLLQESCYHFDSFKDFTNRTTRGFSETPGDNSLQQSTLMCFDIASLLLKGSGCDAPFLESDFSNKGFVSVARDGGIIPVALETFRNATGVLFPANGYEFLTGAQRSEAETRIGLSLRAKRRLSAGCTDSERDLRRVFAMHMDDVKRDGFKFPKNWKLGLGLVVNARKQYVWGDHSFVCIKKRGRYICIEKNGPKGPYVRAEFRSEKDVAQYMSWDLLLDVSNPETSNGGSSVLISLNDRLIGVFHPGKQH